MTFVSTVNIHKNKAKQYTKCTKKKRQEKA